MGMVFCRGCGKEIHESAPTCPHCGAPQNVKSTTADTIPDGIKGWSWGAFLLGPIWAIGNNTWVGLLTLVPYVGFIMSFVLGFKGQEWAWKNKQWDSVEHFNRVQERWSYWGGMFLVVVLIAGAIAIPVYLGYQRQADVTVTTGKTDKFAGLAAAISGKCNPQKNTIEYLIQCAFIPEFKVIAEFAEFDSQKALQTQLRSILGDHAQDPGIYAFYDSMGNLLYLGKATKLRGEISSAINRTVHIAFPKGVKSAPKTRMEIVKYISAYDVGAVKWSDFPKHVESLILRISKPLLNKNIGGLQKAHKQPKET